VTGIGFFLVAWPVSLVLLPDSHLDSATLAIFAFAELVIAPCLMPLAYRYQAAERMSVAGALLTTAPIARFVAILIAMLLGNASLRVFAWLYLGCLLFAAASAVQMLWPRKETGFPRPSISAEIREGLPFAVTNAAATAGGELDKTVMLRYAGDLLTGHYSAASRVAQAAILPVNALMVAAAPRWFRTTRPKQVLSGSGSLFAAAFGYSIIASCAIWLFSPYLPLLLGDDFSSSVSILRFMSVAVVTGSIRQIFGMLLTSSDLQRARNWIEIVAVLSGLALMPFAIPRLGAAGAVLCLVATDVSLIGMGWYVLHLHDKRHADGGA
jgi:O-antigen/teichoic acid export membrane protein